MALSWVGVLASYVFRFLLRFLSGSGVDPASWGDVWRDVLMWWKMIGVVSGWIGYGLRSISMCLLPSASVRCSASLFPLLPAPFPALEEFVPQGLRHELQVSDIERNCSGTP